MSVKKILIYCPNTGGHRHMYAKAFVDYFLRQDAEIIFAHGGLLVGGTKSWPFIPHESSFLSSILRHGKVKMLSLQGRYEPNRQAQLICALQDEYQVSKTVIIDGDAIQWQMALQVLPWRKKFIGATVAVFIFSEFIHPGAVSCLEIVKQWFLHAWWFKYFRVLAGHIWTDEILVKSIRIPHYAFFPDILCEPDADVTVGDDAFLSRISMGLDEFLARNAGRTPVLLFGDWELRKGYNLIYELVKNDQQLVLIRVGRIKPSMKFNWNLTMAREIIFKQERLFEVPCYVESSQFIDRLFGLPKIVALPYMQYYRTSCSMLLAIAKNKPVLVPDIGLLKHRVIHHGVGMTYRHCHYESFAEHFYALTRQCDDYTANMPKYARKFSAQAFTTNLDDIFIGRIIHDSRDFTGFPYRDLFELLLLRIGTGVSGLRPATNAVLRTWRVCRHYWHARRHEKFVRCKWSQLYGQQVVIYGAGQHTVWLQAVLSGISRGPKVMAVWDDCPRPGQTFFNRSVTLPQSLAPGVCVVLSSDVAQVAMELRLKKIFSDDVNMVDLYAGLPPGPYPKRQLDS